MSITSNTNDLQDILTMVNDIEVAVPQNTFQMVKGSCRYTGNLSTYTTTTVECKFDGVNPSQADLVIFYFMQATQDSDQVLYTAGFPLDKKHYYTTNTWVYGGNYANTSSYTFVEIGMAPNDSGFQFIAYYTADGGSSYSAYTTNINYVAYKFNTVT